MLGRIFSISGFVSQAFLLWHCCHEHRLPPHSAVWITISVPSSGDRCLCCFHAGVQQKIKCWIHFSLHQPTFNLPLTKHEVSSFLQRELVTKVCLVPHCNWFCTFPLLFFLVCPVVGIIGLKNTEYYTHCSTGTFRLGHKTADRLSGLAFYIVLWPWLRWTWRFWAHFHSHLKVIDCLLRLFATLDISGIVLSWQQLCLPLRGKLWFLHYHLKTEEDAFCNLLMDVKLFFTPFLPF